MEWLLIILIPIIAFIAYALGYSAGLVHQKRNITSEIMDFIQKNLPDRWEAYKKGAYEGYEAALQDKKKEDLA